MRVVSGDKTRERRQDGLEPSWWSPHHPVKMESGRSTSACNRTYFLIQCAFVTTVVAENHLSTAVNMNTPMHVPICVRDPRSKEDAIVRSEVKVHFHGSTLYPAHPIHPVPSVVVLGERQ